jgi:ATP-binding cassette, subfamily C (CFTR/MRP), member 1
MKNYYLTRRTATSAVDLDTDKAIQSIIRGPLFTDVTMLTIAYVTSVLILALSDFHSSHRLNTIIESDRVLVLDQGQIAEFDNTQNLLGNKDSLFYDLAAEAGIVNSNE